MKPASRSHESDRIIVGRIGGAFGTRGWLKIISYTRPRENICNYRPWLLLSNDFWTEQPVLACKPRGAGLIAQLEGVADRNSALERLNTEIAVQKSVLPQSDPNEYYWSDLIGLEVRNLTGAKLGTIREILQTGANDVLVVGGQSERLIPYVTGHFIIDVDISAGCMLVDWHEDN